VKAKFESRPHMWWALAEALSGRGARFFRALVRACVIGHASLKRAANAGAGAGAARYRGAAGTGLKQRGSFAGLGRYYLPPPREPVTPVY
jgi:hypothetical protein